MSKVEYAFTCPHCGEVFGITARQAGQEIVCPHCGEACTAPRLGQLKQLPVLSGSKADKTPYNPKVSGNKTRNSLFVAGMLLLVLGCGSGYALQQYAQSQLIVDYNVEGAMDRADPYVDELTPFEVAFLFDSMNVDAGLGEWRELSYVSSTKQGNILLKVAYGLYGIGGLGLIMLISSLLIKPKS